MTSRVPLVGVSGQIAAGKSTLTRGLAAHLGFDPVFEEPEKNPYLARYYRDPRRWALRSFLFFFEQSLSGQVDARVKAAGVVQERLLQEHLDVFGRHFHGHGFLSNDDMTMLEGLGASARALLPAPTVLVHLEIDPATALTRMQARGRLAETGVTLEYLQELGGRYEAFLAGWSASPVVRVDARAIDVRTPDGVNAVAKLVSPYVGEAVRSLAS